MPTLPRWSTKTSPRAARAASGDVARLAAVAWAAGLAAFAAGCFETRILDDDEFDGGGGGAAPGTGGIAGPLGSGGRGSGSGSGGFAGTGGVVGGGSGGFVGTGGARGSGGRGGTGGTGAGGAGAGGARGTGGAGTGGARGTGGAGTGGARGTGGAGTGGAGTGGAGTGGAGTGGAGTGGAGTGGAGTGGAGTGGAGTGGAGTGGAGTGGAGTGGAGTGGASPPLYKEDWEDGDIAGWAIAFTDHYSYALDPGTGASGTSRALLLNKIMDSMYCCEGFIGRLPAAIAPRTISYWIRAGQSGLSSAVGYFALYSTEDASGNIMYSSFYGSSIWLTGATGAPGVPFVVDRWHHIELRNIDWTAHRFDYYVDDNLIVPGMSMGSAASSVLTIQMFTSRTTSVTIPRVYYDEIEMR